MIRSVSDRETRRIWDGWFSRKLPLEMQWIARRKLRMINNAQDLNDLRVPTGNRLGALRGKRKGKYSIRINQQWRICFEWRDNDAFEVEIVDYH
jgi:proteic killer suppression protein